MSYHEAPAIAASDAPRLDQDDRPTLRFVTCGSVDDGKSTLVGRLLYDSKTLLDDQLDALTSESRTVGTTGGDLDFALLVDGLQAEREQGITIDVAYRFFATPLRRFIVADTPGHAPGFCGRIAAGTIRAGDAVAVQPSGRQTQVARILTPGGERDRAAAGESVTLTLADEIDVSRGDVLTAGSTPQISDQLAAHLVWFDDQAMVAGRRYVLKCATASIGAVITSLEHRIAIDTMAQESGTTLDANQIGQVHLRLDRPLVFEAYRDDRDMGSFILIDPISHRTAAAGMIDLSLSRATNIHRHRLAVDKSVRARLKQQRPCVLWFTGFSGAGKSTIADLVDRRLAELGRHAALLDGDNLRHGINRDLGFSSAERMENVRRVAEIAALFVDAGMIALVALISPFRSERALARQRVETSEFIEIHVATPLAECERRDPKGLYRKARAGELTGFTGIDDPYEAPQAPEISIDTSELSSDAACERIIRYLRDNHYL